MKNVRRSWQQGFAGKTVQGSAKVFGLLALGGAFFFAPLSVTTAKAGDDNGIQSRSDDAGGSSKDVKTPPKDTKTPPPKDTKTPPPKDTKTPPPKTPPPKTPPGKGEDDDDDGNKNVKHTVVLCHKGHTIRIPLRELRKHLKQGDTLGPCKVTTVKNF